LCLIERERERDTTQMIFAWYPTVLRTWMGVVLSLQHKIVRTGGLDS